MTATNTAGALKAFIESIPSSGLQAVGRDSEPQGQALPYVNIIGPLTLVPDKLEGGGSVFAATGGAGSRTEGETQTLTELYQVDLWQSWKKADGTLAESSTLPDVIVSALHGARLPAHPKVVYGCLVRGAPRDLERDSNLVHHSITVEIHRQL